MQVEGVSLGVEEAGSGLPTLVFVSGRRSGASRKMESLVAWVKVTQKRRLRVVDLDADRSPEIVGHLGVRKIPSLLLVEDGQIVDRLEGRATGRQIDALIRPHLPEEGSQGPVG
jgi:thioredoxin-like negative regulator of GroEL